MIGAHRNLSGGFEVRRDEHPFKRKNPSGKIRWVARYTDSEGHRQRAGTHAKEGPCKHPTPDGRCCAQHAIWKAYETDRPRRSPVETVGEYFEVWLKRHPRAVRTNLTYEGRVRAVLDVRIEDTRLGMMRMREVRVRHANDLVDVMLTDQGRAASGVRGVLAVLASMWRDAIGDDVAEGNPFRDVRPPRDTDPRVQKAARKVTVASWADMHRLASHAGLYEPMIRTLADCGLRLGELLALHCKHVQGDVLVVEQTAFRRIITPGTKTVERREVPIPPVLRTMLGAAKEGRIGLLFPDARGDVWAESSFYAYVWRPAVERSGVKLRPHDLRHSHVSLLRAAGIDPADLARISGHTVETATRAYTHSVGNSFDQVRGAVGA